SIPAARFQDRPRVRAGGRRGLRQGRRLPLKRRRCSGRHGENAGRSIFRVVFPAPLPPACQVEGYPEGQADPDSRRDVVDRHADCDADGDSDRQAAAHRAHSALLTISAQAASSITSIPSSAAFFSLLPAPGPATTRSVLGLTAPAALAPSRSAWALASSRLIVSSLPVNTTVFPLTGLSFVSTTNSGGSTSLSRSSHTSRLCSSWKKSPSASTTTGPTPSIERSSALASSPARGGRPSAGWGRGTAGWSRPSCVATAEGASPPRFA